MIKYFRGAVCALIFSVGMAACSSGASTVAPPPHKTGCPAMIYVVANANSNALTAYSLTANGNVAPCRTISGANTGLGFPRRVITDPANDIVVSNAPASGIDSITIYHQGATGNAAPATTISGANTGLTGADGIAFDAAGLLYVANCATCFQGSGTNGILVFSAGSSGNIAPASTISGASTGLAGPTNVAIDTSNNIWVSVSGTNSIEEFAAGASGNVAPMATLAGANTGINGPECVAFDASGAIYVCDSNDATITVYPKNSSGNVAPSRTLAGASTGLTGPTAIAFDAAGNMYVANSGANAITVYAPGATGNQAPLFTLVGASTALALPIGVAVAHS